MSETIQQFINSGDTVTAYCQNPACGHRQVLDMLKLRDKLGPDHGSLHDDLVPKMRCSKCGGKDIGLIRSSNKTASYTGPKPNQNMYAKLSGRS